MTTRKPHTLRLVEAPEAVDETAWEAAVETRINPMLRAFAQMSPREQILTLKVLFDRLPSRPQLDVLNWCVGCFFSRAGPNTRAALRRRVGPKGGKAV